VGSRLEPAQQVFGPDDGEGEALQRAIQGRGEEKAAGLDERGGGRDEGFRIGDVLDHLHRAHDVEAPRLRGELFDRRRAIGEPRAGLLRMAAGRRDRSGRRIDADDVRAEARQRLGKQPRAAADVEKADPGERRPCRRLELEMPPDQIARPADPDRVEAMQRRHRPIGVPPGVAQRVETGDLLGHDARRWPGRHLNPFARRRDAR
jgi:hypothetical protein